MCLYIIVGKTMVARSIAKHCRATFLNIKASSLHNKYFGESEKLVAAIFSLAAKLAPTIVFIDEIDLFLKRSSQSESHTVSSSIQGEFLSLWDGLLNDSRAGRQITVLGCTNRPYDIDDAILRRLSRQFFFPLPSAAERAAIVQVMMKEVRVDESIIWEEIGALTDEYSGSDLKEVCRYAVMQPIREVIAIQRQKEQQAKQRQQQQQENPSQLNEDLGISSSLNSKDGVHSIDNGVELNLSGLTGPVRPVSKDDFYRALSVIPPTGVDSMRYLMDFKKKEAARMRGV